MSGPPDLRLPRPRPIAEFCDARGSLWKALSAGAPGLAKGFGEIYVLKTNTGAVRGSHYHRLTTEWFVCVEGRIRLRLAVPGAQERAEYLLDSGHPEVIEIPPGVAHSLTQEEEHPSIVLAYADRPYDEGSPDAVPFNLLQGE